MNHRLRILHVMRNADLGGLSRYVIDLCTALHQAGHEVIVAADEGPMARQFHEAPFQFIEIPLRSHPIDFLRCVGRLREVKVDLIHAHYRRATLLGRRLQREKRPPLLYTLHLSHMPVNWWRRPFTDFGDHVHVAAEEARDWLIADCNIAPDRITLIHHGIQTDRFPQRTTAGHDAARSGLNLPADATVAAYVGRFDDPKNEAWLLDLAEAMPQLHLVLAGEGPHEAELRDQIKTRSLASRVHLLSYREPLPIYQAADLFLLPSAREGFALSCAEAMSVGVPVLRTRTSGTAAMIIENETGRSTAIDHDEFIAVAMEMLSDRKKLDRMGLAAANLVREKLTFDRQVSDTISLYRRLISSTNTRINHEGTEARR